MAKNSRTMLHRVNYFIVFLSLLKLGPTYGWDTCSSFGRTSDASNVFFFLRTKKSELPKRLILGIDKTITDSGFKKGAPTIIFSHGFTSAGGGDSAKTIVDAYMKHPTFYNVIAVDWCRLASPVARSFDFEEDTGPGTGSFSCFSPEADEMDQFGYETVHTEGGGEMDEMDWSIPVPYLTASCNVLGVGEYVAKMIQYLIKKGYTTTKKLHVMGHSLGAHVSGVAGYHVQKLVGTKVARITGFDPAAPTFYGAPLAERLDSTDADFVDVIHSAGTVGGSWTDPLGYFALGMLEPIGHLDFYPNAGTAPQPGCEHWLLPFSTQWGSCGHARSFVYYGESVYSPCAFPSCKCDHFAECRTDVPCKNKVYMGFAATKTKDNTEKSKGGYYAITNPEAPFGMGQEGPCKPRMKDQYDIAEDYY